MGYILINTELVVGAADRITENNNKAQQEFSKLEKSVNKLNNSWSGAAADGFINRFYAIKNSGLDARYKELDNYARFLREVVGEGYENTETTNTKLAEAFK